MLESLFVAEDITEQVHTLAGKVSQLRELALQVVLNESSDTITHCYKPGTCPCPALCHPNLPEFSIYDIPRLSLKHKQSLLSMDIHKAEDVPSSFPLNAKQSQIVQLAKTGCEIIDVDAIQRELAQLELPLYFLDYETTWLLYRSLRAITHSNRRSFNILCIAWIAPMGTWHIMNI